MLKVASYADEDQVAAVKEISIARLKEKEAAERKVFDDKAAKEKADAPKGYQRSEQLTMRPGVLGIALRFGEQENLWYWALFADVDGVASYGAFGVCAANPTTGSDDGRVARFNLD